MLKNNNIGDAIQYESKYLDQKVNMKAIYWITNQFVLGRTARRPHNQALVSGPDNGRNGASLSHLVLQIKTYHINMITDESILCWRNNCIGERSLHILGMDIYKNFVFLIF